MPPNGFSLSRTLRAISSRVSKKSESTIETCTRQGQLSFYFKYTVQDLHSLSSIIKTLVFLQRIELFLLLLIMSESFLGVSGYR
jgi:hypothetical protein